MAKVDKSNVVGVEPGFATGLLLRRFAESTLGEMNLQDVFSLATTVAEQPEALGSVIGMTEEQSRQMDPFAVRDRILDSYFAQRYAQDLAGTQDAALDEAEAESSARVQRMAGAAAVSPDRLQEALDRASGGDCSAMNRIEEIYYFE